VVEAEIVTTEVPGSRQIAVVGEAAVPNFDRQHSQLLLSTSVAVGFTTCAPTAVEVVASHSMIDTRDSAASLHTAA
jgi:hypothetical protein